MISSRKNGLSKLVLVFQILSIQGVFWLYYLILFPIRDIEFPSFNTYFKYSVVVVFALLFEALTRPRHLGNFVNKNGVKVSFRQLIWILIFVFAAQVFSKDQELSRVFLAGFVCLAGSLLIVQNSNITSITNKFGRLLLKNWKLRIVAVGSETWIDPVISSLKTADEAFDVKDSIIFDGDIAIDLILGRIENQEPDIVVFSGSFTPDSFTAKLIEHADNLGYQYWATLDLPGLHTGRNFHIEKIKQLNVLMSPPMPLEDALNRLIKRAFDFLFALLAVVFVLPFLVGGVWVLHRLFSSGPLFFRQERVGEGGQIFRIFKFRSLKVQNPNESLQVSTNDDRLFRGGRFIRKTSIDEFPQFFNVLVGNMSIVGPRPHIEEHEKAFSKLHKKYGLRRQVKPGLTGLAQVKGLRGEVRASRDIRHRARMDLFYVENWSFIFDINIIFKTVRAVLFPPKSAY
jgi:exopolysaccharide biosynthesis polyprenyl glycosylphosphotransferase